MSATAVPPRAAWRLSITLGLVAFAVHLWVALTLERLRIFGDADVLFQSDINFRLVDMAHAMSTGADVRHPNFGLFISPFVRAAAALPARLFVHPRDAVAVYAWREQVALLVSPLAGALRSATLYRIARRLGAAEWAAVVVVLLDLVAFGSLLLGSVPESFPLTAACTALLCWFLLDDRPHSARRTGWWVLVGAFAVGVTSSNVVTLGILAACAALRRIGPDWRAWTVRGALGPARWVALVLAGVVAVNGLGLLVASRVLHHPVAVSSPPGQSFLHGRPVRAAGELALAFGNTFLAPAPTVVPNTTTRLPWPDEHTRRFDVDTVPVSLTYPFPPPARVAAAQAWRATLVWLALAAGTAASAATTRRNWAGRVLFVGVLAVLAWNVALHLVFGHEFLLYSQHWAPLLAVLLTGLALVRGRWRAPALAGLVAFTAVVAVDAPRRVAGVIQLLAVVR